MGGRGGRGMPVLPVVYQPQNTSEPEKPEEEEKLDPETAKYSKVLQQTLGPKSSNPRSIEDTLKVTNPHYFEDEKWQINCQRCIYAYEMQRRGYDVEALPAEDPFYDTLPLADGPKGWLRVMQDAKRVVMPRRNTIKAMQTQMTEWGEGARAIVRVQWKRGDCGHVFMAETTKNGVLFVDPQPGIKVNIDYYMDRAVKKETFLVRVDNLQPTDLLAKCVKRRGK